MCVCVCVCVYVCVCVCVCENKCSLTLKTNINHLDEIRNANNATRKCMCVFEV